MRSWYARAGLILTQELGDLVVTAAKLALGAVTTDKLADAAVTTPKIAQLAIGVGKIQDGAVTAVKLASSAVRQTNMHTATSELSGSINAGAGLNILLTAYAFFPMLYGAGPLDVHSSSSSSSSTADEPRLNFTNNNVGPAAYTVRWRAMQA